MTRSSSRASGAPEPSSAPTAATASGTTSPRPTLKERIVAWVTEFLQFGLVGALAYVVDSGLFVLLQHGPLGVLAGHPNTANAASATIATIFSWVANRLWTYRGRTQENVAREALLFALANVGGLFITQFCLLFTHHVLGLTSAIADMIAAYVVGFGLGTAFRFTFYHYIVFNGGADKSPKNPESPKSPENPASAEEIEEREEIETGPGSTRRA